jgi:hypothetical protein
VIGRWIVPRARSIEHEGCDRDGPVVGLLLNEIALDLEVAARERAWEVRRVCQERLVARDQVHVVGADEVEADGAGVEEEGERRGE